MEIKLKKDLDELFEYLDKNRFNDLEIYGKEYKFKEMPKVYFGIINIKTLKEINCLMGHASVDELLKEFEKHLKIYDGIGIYKLGGQEWVYISFEKIKTKIFATTHVYFYLDLNSLSKEHFEALDRTLYYKRAFNMGIGE